MQFIATDTETGGVYPAIHALLSIGACCSWSPDTFLGYITPESQPGKTVCAEAAAKNGYTPEKWAALGAQSLAEVFPQFLAWIKARKAERTGAKIVCHNLAFDRSFFSEAERVTGYEIPHRHDWRCSQVKFGELMDAGLIEHGSSALDRLIELSHWTGLRLDEHDALQDAEATLHGYTWLIENSLMPVCGARRILIERQRQQTSEKWTAAHDDLFINGELRDAGIAYAMACDDRAGEDVSNIWPWEPEWWKPSVDPIRNLEKAGALFAAEIDRLNRAQKKEGRDNG